MNNWTGIGRLTKDPEIRYTQSQKAVASFTLAVDRRIKREGGPDADFFPCTAWGKTAEFMEKYWKKGMKAAITGRIENEAWQDKDGGKHTTTKVIVDTIEFCEKKGTETTQGQSGSEFMDIPEDDEDLPFKF